LSLRELFHNTTLADRILFSLLIVLSLSGIAFIKEILSDNSTVHIYVDGHPAYILPLDKNRVVSVEGPQGKTVVEIKDHQVRIIESPCHNKLCIQTGWVRSGAVVCLPNRVVVTLGDPDKHKKTIDATTG